MMDNALGLFSGSDLVIHAINDRLASQTGMSEDEVVGVPAREVWFDPAARTAQAIMSAVLVDGVVRSVDLAGPDGQPGVLTVYPVYRGRHRWGVATNFAAE